MITFKYDYLVILKYNLRIDKLYTTGDVLRKPVWCGSSFITVVKFVQFYHTVCFYNVIAPRWLTKLIATKESNLIHTLYIINV